MGIGTTCAVLALVLAQPIASLYGDPRVAGVVVALAGLLIVSGVTTQFRAELSRDLRFGPLGVVELAAQAGGVAVAITSAALGAGYWSIVAQQATVVLLTCVLCVAFCGWRPGLPRRATSVRRFVRFGSHVLGTQVLGYATNNVDNVAIGAVWGAGPLGVYSRAYQLLMVPINQINDPMSRVVLPVLSRVQDDAATLQRYVEKAQRVGTYGLGPLFAVAAGVAAPLVALLFGPQWSAVVPVFVALAVGGVFRGFGLVTYWGFLASGRADRQLRMYLVTRPLMIGLILAGLPWGPVGVAVGHSAAFAVYWIVALTHLGKVTGLDSRRLFAQALAALAVLALPVGLLAYLGTRLVDGAVWQLLVGGLLAAAWVGLLLLALPAQRAELAGARGLLQRQGVAAS